MTYDINGLERMIDALETSFIGIRLYDAVSPRYRSPGPGCVVTYYFTTGQRRPSCR